MVHMVTLTHPCPGGCGEPAVPYNQYACGSCWWRLPQHLRVAINETWRNLGRPGTRHAHRAAMAQAAAWYRANPRAGTP